MSTSQFGFVTFGLTYLAFLGLEYLRPGFVANVLSVHWLLLVTAVSGVAWSRSSVTKRSPRDVTLAAIIGLLAAIIVWTEGGAFGDARLFLSLAVLCLPALALMSFRNTT